MLNRELGLRLLLSVFAVLVVTAIPHAAEQEVRPLQAQKSALAELNNLIGDWRGVGQPKRGSRSGAWSEKASWVWHFDKEAASVDYNVTDGRLLKSARIRYSPESNEYTLAATMPDGSSRTYHGKRTGNKFVFLSDDSTTDTAHRLTITPLNWQRTLVLFESKPKTRTQFTRVAEVGYTRAGTRLAKSGTGGPVCIVTGGTGTSTVEYLGKKYWICCSGCRDAFNDDPAGIIAESKARLKQKTK